MPKLKKYKTKVILLTIVWAIVICSAIAFLTAAQQTLKNTNVIEGRFDHVEKGIGTGRASGSVWYDIYVQKSQNFYTISADNSHCFLFYKFTALIKVGNPIQLYINKPDVFSIRKPMVVAVIVNNETYLSFDCINDEIEKERVRFPLYLFGFGLLFTILLFKKEVAYSLKDKYSY